MEDEDGLEYIRGSLFELASFFGSRWELDISLLAISPGFYCHLPYLLSHAVLEQTPGCYGCACLCARSIRQV